MYFTDQASIMKIGKDSIKTRKSLNAKLKSCNFPCDFFRYNGKQIYPSELSI